MPVLYIGRTVLKGQASHYIVFSSSLFPRPSQAQIVVENDYFHRKCQSCLIPGKNRCVKSNVIFRKANNGVCNKRRWAQTHSNLFMGPADFTKPSHDLLCSNLQNGCCAQWLSGARLQFRNEVENQITPDEKWIKILDLLLIVSLKVQNIAS